MKYCVKCNSTYEDYFIACPSCDLGKKNISDEEFHNEPEAPGIGPFNLFAVGKKAYFEEFFIQLKAFRTPPEKPRNLKNLTEPVNSWTIFFAMIVTFILVALYAIRKSFMN